MHRWPFYTKSGQLWTSPLERDQYLIFFKFLESTELQQNSPHKHTQVMKISGRCRQSEKNPKVGGQNFYFFFYFFFYFLFFFSPTNLAKQNCIHPLWSLKMASDVFHEFLTSNFGGEDGGFSWAAFQKSAVAVGKEFGMAEGNFVTKNARSEVKEFATEM